MKRRLFLAAYDIKQPSRLREALYVLKDFACGGQDSVFECWLTGAEKSELMARMVETMDTTEDRFFVIPLDERGAFACLGTAVAAQDSPLYYVG